ncbi:MAG: hypothetical protein IPO77_21140 [Acidobacteria bacterium]|nr:hypothetical protein [Acidobacteriota bacterium]
MVEIRAGAQASRLRVLKYLHIHIRFALIELMQARRLRSRSYFDSVISDNLPKDEFANSISPLVSQTLNNQVSGWGFNF